MKNIFFVVLAAVVFINVFPGKAFAEDSLAETSAVEPLVLTPDMTSTAQFPDPLDRDPFQSPIEEAPIVVPVLSESVGMPMPMSEVSVKLEGVGIGSREQDAFALINGEVFYEGEEKQDIKLVQVRKQEVELLVNGMPKTVKLILEEEILKMQKRKEVRTGQAKKQEDIPE